jgi:hypothetical protein
VAASASGFAQLVVENPQQPPTPAPANERELGAILVENLYRATTSFERRPMNSPEPPDQK